MAAIPEPVISGSPASRRYQMCGRCIMDTSDPGICFDSAGVCNRCRDYELRVRTYVPPADQREAALARLVEEIRLAGRSREFDCIIGVSGGVDSTYVAFLVHSLGLRALAVHLDNGWDSNLAVTNIERALRKLNIELFTHVLDWDEFRNLQLAFLKASTPDSEIPTDHAIMAVLMRKARHLRVRYILYGSNIITEGLYTPEWSQGHYDWKYIKSIHARFGTVPLRRFPHVSLAQYCMDRYVRHQQFVSVLNYTAYNKVEAVEIIRRELGWEPYEGKHHESIYTRFFQSYILPRKFGADKRRMHLSALIVSGQMARDEALRIVATPPGPPDQLEQDKVYVCKKLDISIDEFDRIMDLPPRTFWDYPSNEKSAVMRWYRKHRSFFPQQR
jgi:N-acetyl sugar amidotransferase